MKYLLGLVILLGAGLRLFHFLDNRSLWHDEVWLIENLINRTFVQLASPLAHNQHAPLGFLWTEKLISLWLGEADWVFRLFPLLCGLASLPMMFVLCRQWLSLLGQCLALGCLAFCYPAVYHSVEAKQYATELLVSLCVLLVYTHYQQLPAKAWKLALAGALGLWFSFGLFFLLPGILLAMIPLKRWKGLTLVAGSWGLSALTAYLWLLRPDLASGEAKGAWEAFFFYPFQWQGWVWIPRMLFYALDDPLGLNIQVLPTLDYLLRLSWPGCLLLLVGMYAFSKKSPSLLLTLLCPLVLLAVAAVLRLYPPYQRLVLFYAPVAFLVIGAGTDYLYDKPGHLFSWMISGWQLLYLLLNVGLPTFQTPLFGDFRRNDIREAVLYLRKLAPERVYVYSSLWDVTRFYTRDTPWEMAEISQEQDPLLKPARGQVVLMHLPAFFKYKDPALRKLHRREYNRRSAWMEGLGGKKVFEGIEVAVYVF